MSYFGTDGIRLAANAFTTEFLAAIVKGLSDYFASLPDDHTPKILLGGDTRESTEWILSDLETILESFGFEYGNVGVLPTPAIHYCFSRMGFNLAIDVTASHNPYTDNGIKIFELGPDGPGKLSAPGREFVEKAIAKLDPYDSLAPTLRENLHLEALGLYAEHLKTYLEPVDLSGLHLAMDCANGATSVIGKTIFEALGAEVELIHADTHYNTKINHDCGSTHPEDLQTLVRDGHFDFGMAFDGDGDRCILVDDGGEIVDGDQIVALLANFLGLKAFATTVMANQGLLNYAKTNHLDVTITAVGDSNVAAAMKEKGLKIGGEQSGHIILPGEVTGDGMLTALLVAKVVKETGKSLRELASPIPRLPQIMIGLPADATGKASLESEAVTELTSDYTKKLEAISGRLLVRPSGTEDLIRITMWGEDESKLQSLINDLGKELAQVLNNKEVK